MASTPNQPGSADDRKLPPPFHDHGDDEVEKECFREAFDYVVKTCDKVMGGKVKLDGLVVSKVLRKPIGEYQSVFPHVVAAMQMIQKGKKLKPGDMIDFVYVNAAHNNPFRRVVPASLLSGHHCYDREKYVEMVLDVAETILSVFGFSRKQLSFGNKSKISSKKPITRL